MHTTLAGRRTLITGGSRGIGRAIVGRFAEAGAQVLFTSRDHEADALADTLEQRGAHVTCQHADVGDLADIEQFTMVAARELAPRAITVNAAAPGATDTDLLRAGAVPYGVRQWCWGSSGSSVRSRWTPRAHARTRSTWWSASGGPTSWTVRDHGRCRRAGAGVAARTRRAPS